MTEKNVITNSIGEVTNSVVRLGRKVAGQWLRVGRGALDAAAESLKSTSQTLAELSNQIDKTTQKTES